MPIVSVNLSGSSYRVYEQWKKDRKGSRMVSAAIMAYELRQLEDRLRLGDRRHDGPYTCVWTEKGWIPVEDEEE